MTLKDSYSEIAYRYDQFHGEFGKYDSQTYEFFKKIFQDHNITSVLDCACGTGRHLPLFQSLGCEVIGSDASTEMLNRARVNLSTLGANIEVLEADYRNLPEHFNKKFDAVVCLTSSILHTPNDSEFLRALKSMKKVLNNGGLLILTQGTADKQWSEKPRFILGPSHEKSSRVFVIDYHENGATYNMLDIHHPNGQSSLQSWSITYNKVFLHDDHKKLLTESGFKDIQFYGDYDFVTYNKQTSKRLISTAVKNQ